MFRCLFRSSSGSS